MEKSGLGSWSSSAGGSRQIAKSQLWRGWRGLLAANQLHGYLAGVWWHPPALRWLVGALCCWCCRPKLPQSSLIWRGCQEIPPPLQPVLGEPGPQMGPREQGLGPPAKLCGPAWYRLLPGRDRLGGLAGLAGLVQNGCALAHPHTQPTKNSLCDGRLPAEGSSVMLPLPPSPPNSPSPPIPCLLVGATWMRRDGSAGQQLRNPRLRLQDRKPPQ